MRNHISQRQRDSNKKKKMVDDFMLKLTSYDYINFAFGKPFEVSLKFNHGNFLSQGLMLAAKDSIKDDKYELVTIDLVDPTITMVEQLQDQYLNNYLSLLKKIKHNDHKQNHSKAQRQNSSVQSEKQIVQMQIGICISMCNEDTNLLKKTLVSVVLNIKNLIQSGVSPDDIFIVVIIDGIANTNKSLYLYLEQFERINRTFLQEEIYTMERQHRSMKEHRITEEKLFLSKFYLTPQEVQQRIDCKPKLIHQRYMEVLSHKRQIQQIFKGGQVRTIIQNMLDDNQRFVSEDTSLREKKDTATIIKQLSQIQQICNVYLSSRESLAYITAYKLSIDNFSMELKEIHQEQLRQRRQINQHNVQNQKHSQLKKPFGLKDIKIVHNNDYQDLNKYINLLFCIKYRESGKLCSHNWFINGFCQQLKPKFTVLIDVGVLPQPGSILKMYQRMKVDKNIGGVCGHIRLQKQIGDSFRIKAGEADFLSRFLTKTFDLSKIQKMDNHFHHLIQKPFESICGFYHSLPTSFSAYNMQILKYSGANDFLLSEYFKQPNKKINYGKIQPTQFTAKKVIQCLFLPDFCIQVEENSEDDFLYSQNLYSALDRIFCLGIQKGEKRIQFMLDCQAVTAPLKVIDQIMQAKKKKINSQYYLRDKSKKQLIDLGLLARFQFIQNGLYSSLSYFMFPLVTLIVDICLHILQVEIFVEQENLVSTRISIFANNIIICLLGLILGKVLLMSLNTKFNHKTLRYTIYLITTILGISSFFCSAILVMETVFMFIGRQKCNALIMQIWQASKINFKEVLCGGLQIFVPIVYKYIFGANLFMIILPFLSYSLMFCKFDGFCQLFSGFFSLVFYLPIYILIAPIYAKCRIDEIHLNLDSVESRRADSNLKIIRTLKLIKYVLWNASLTLLVLFAIQNVYKFCIVVFIFTILTIGQLFKIVPVMVYMLWYRCGSISGDKNSYFNYEQNSLDSNIYKILRQIQDDCKQRIREGFQQSAFRVYYQSEYVYQNLNI